MSKYQEAERIKHNVRGEKPPSLEVRIRARATGASRECLARVREVMEIVAKQREREDWPKDSWWRHHLPSWFLDPFRGRSMEDVLANPELWDFGSWLDAIKSPGWEWWSSEDDKEGWTVRLQAYSDPFSIGPLEYLARAAGADSIEVEEGGEAEEGSPGSFR